MENEIMPRIVLFVTMTGSGILLFWMAKATSSGRLGRNQVAGIRIPSTLASDEAWLAAHRRAERPTLWGALFVGAAGVGAILPVPLPVVVVSVLVGCVAMLGFVLYGARVGSVAAKAVTAARERQ